LVNYTEEIPYGIFESDKIKRWLLEDVFIRFQEDETVGEFINSAKKEEIIAQVEKLQSENLDHFDLMLCTKGEISEQALSWIIPEMVRVILEVTKLDELIFTEIFFVIIPQIIDDINDRSIIPEDIRDKLITPLSEQELPPNLQEIQDKFVGVIETKTGIVSDDGEIKVILDTLEKKVKTHRRNMANDVRRTKEEIIEMVNELGKKKLLAIKYIIITHDKGIISDGNLLRAMEIINIELLWDIVGVIKEIERKIRQLYAIFDEELKGDLWGQQLSTEEVISEIIQGLEQIDESLGRLHAAFVDYKEPREEPIGGF
jgi:hypothetical protein